LSRIHPRTNYGNCGKVPLRETTY